MFAILLLDVIVRIRAVIAILTIKGAVCITIVSFIFITSTITIIVASVRPSLLLQMILPWSFNLLLQLPLFLLYVATLSVTNNNVSIAMLMPVAIIVNIIVVNVLAPG